MDPPPDLHFEVQMAPWASILRSQWRPGGPSETPWAYFGGLGGDVGAPGGFMEALGEHFGALRVASGPLGSAPGTVLAAFLVICWMILEYLLRVQW